MREWLRWSSDARLSKTTTDSKTEFTPGGEGGKVSEETSSSVHGGTRQAYSLCMMRLNCMAQDCAGSMRKRRQISHLYHRIILSDHLGSAWAWP